MQNPLQMLSRKKRDVGWQEVSHGWAKQNNQFRLCAVSQSSSKKGTGKNVQLSSSHTTRLCCEWSSEKASAEVQMLVEANSKPHDIVICRDDSITRDQSGWGFTVKRGGRTVHEDSGAHRVTTSSLTMEVEAVTNANTEVESGMSCPNWHTAMHSLRIQRLLWIYCPGHTGVSGNERADRPSSTADITSGLHLDRAEVLSGLRNFLNMGWPEHHSIDRLKERGVEKGSGRHSTLQGERSVFNQTNIRGHPWGDC